MSDDKKAKALEYWGRMAAVWDAEEQAEIELCHSFDDSEYSQAQRRAARSHAQDVRLGIIRLGGDTLSEYRMQFIYRTEYIRALQTMTPEAAPVVVLGATEWLNSVADKGTPVFYDFMTTKQSLLVYAEKGAGKTWLVMCLALAAAGGYDWNGYQGAGVPVMVADGEMDVSEWMERAELICKWHGWDLGRCLDRLSMYFATSGKSKPVALREPEDREVFKRAVLDAKPALLVLDNFTTLFAVEDENSSGEIHPMNELLIELRGQGVATVVVDHTGKNASAGPRGSSNKTTVVNYALGLKKARGHDGLAFSTDWDKWRGKPTPLNTARTYVLDESKGFTMVADTLQEEQSSAELAYSLWLNGQVDNMDHWASLVGVSVNALTKKLLVQVKNLAKAQGVTDGAYGWYKLRFNDEADTPMQEGAEPQF